MRHIGDHLKKNSTLIVSEYPELCPACGCPRFERQPRSMLDKTLSRKARFQCIKCSVTTLVVEDMEPASLEQESESNNETAHYKFILGTMHATGNGADKDEKAAVICFQEAAELGHTAAQFNLAVCLIKGMGAGQNLNLGRDWMRRAAEQGHEKASLALPNVERIINSSAD